MQNSSAEEPEILFNLTICHDEHDRQPICRTQDLPRMNGLNASISPSSLATAHIDEDCWSITSAKRSFDGREGAHHVGSSLPSLTHSQHTISETSTASTTRRELHLYAKSLHMDDLDDSLLGIADGQPQTSLDRQGRLESQPAESPERLDQLSRLYESSVVTPYQRITELNLTIQGHLTTASPGPMDRYLNSTEDRLPLLLSYGRQALHGATPQKRGHREQMLSDISESPANDKLVQVYVNSSDAEEPHNTERVMLENSNNSSQDSELFGIDLTGLRSLLDRSNKLLDRLRHWFNDTPDETLLTEIRVDIKYLLSRQNWPQAVCQPHSEGQENQEGYLKNSSPLLPASDAIGTLELCQHPHGIDDQLRRARPRVSTRAEGKISPKRRLHCPLYFQRQGDDAGCTKLWDYMRDLIRHLNSHGHFFCTRCSLYRQGHGRRERARFTSHEKQHKQKREFRKFCAYYECVNKKDSALPHARLSRCVYEFVEMSNKDKWFSIFSMTLPGVALPDWWSEVYVLENDPTAGRMVARDLVSPAPSWSQMRTASRYSTDPVHDQPEASLSIAASEESEVRHSFDVDERIDLHQPRSTAATYGHDPIVADLATQEVLEQFSTPLYRLEQDQAELEHFATTLLQLEHDRAELATQDIMRNALFADSAQLKQDIQAQFHEHSRGLLRIAGLFLSRSEIAVQNSSLQFPAISEVQTDSAAQLYARQRNFLGQIDVGGANIIGNAETAPANEGNLKFAERTTEPYLADPSTTDAI